MQLPLVVGVDGSDFSLTAVDWAVDEAARRGLPLRLVHASSREQGAASSDGLERPAGQVMAENIVGSATERARRRNPQVKVSSEIHGEDAVHALLREGDDAFALVTGSRGRSEFKGLLLGSVSRAVAARARCPVIVVRGDKAGLAGVHERILLGAAKPAAIGEALRFACREAETRGCVLDVVRAWRCPALETTDHPRLTEAAALRYEQRAAALLDALLQEAMRDHPDVPVRRATVEGPARTVLLKRSAAADLVVIGARHRPGTFGLRLGRVAHVLLHHADCPVAIVPQRV
ncbi:universal stress protein [Streptomyces chiangmaiensis]|uniref:Universal stress protein n=1 Tax=Streptomyces chiangmaiensis TaxID=766497 RepID=A0ABU7FCZ8_9ACTN|nr:universal stress protein [Streptomyces chiangmaiensis]MED7821779.1 universal stress protein [Streptomyces chiangmaiensis]